MKKVLTLLFSITAVLITACAPNTPKYETVNDCEIRPETQCSKFALSGADLRGADLSGAILSEAILSEAILRGADLREAVLSGTYLSGADLSDADLSGADLSEASLIDALYNEYTKFPEGFDPETAGMVLAE